MSGLIVLIIAGIIVVITSKVVDVSLKKVSARKRNVMKVLFSSLAVVSVWVLVFHQVYWAKYQCAFNTSFDIKRTVSANGFYIDYWYPDNWHLMDLINGGYSFLETKTYKHEKPYIKHYIALNADPNCREDIFNKTDYRSKLMKERLPSPPLPEGYCIAAVHQDSIQSQYKYDLGSPIGENGKQTIVKKIIEIKSNKTLGTWTGFNGTTGGGLLASERCLQPDGEQLFQKVLIPKPRFNKSSKRDAVTGAPS